MRKKNKWPKIVNTYVFAGSQSRFRIAVLFWCSNGQSIKNKIKSTNELDQLHCFRNDSHQVTTTPIQKLEFNADTIDSFEWIFAGTRLFDKWNHWIGWLERMLPAPFILFYIQSQSVVRQLCIVHVCTLCPLLNAFAVFVRFYFYVWRSSIEEVKIQHKMNTNFNLFTVSGCVCVGNEPSITAFPFCKDSPTQYHLFNYINWKMRRSIEWQVASRDVRSVWILCALHTFQWAFSFVDVLYGTIRIRGERRAIHFQSWRTCNVWSVHWKFFALTHTHTYLHTDAGSNVWRESVSARARNSSCYTNTIRLSYGSRVTRMLWAMIGDDVRHVRYVWMGRRTCRSNPPLYNVWAREWFYFPIFGVRVYWTIIINRQRSILVWMLVNIWKTSETLYSNVYFDNLHCQLRLTQGAHGEVTGAATVFNQTELTWTFVLQLNKHFALHIHTATKFSIFGYLFTSSTRWTENPMRSSCRSTSKISNVLIRIYNHSGQTTLTDWSLRRIPNEFRWRNQNSKKKKKWRRKTLEQSHSSVY